MTAQDLGERLPLAEMLRQWGLGLSPAACLDALFDRMECRR